MTSTLSAIQISRSTLPLIARKGPPRSCAMVPTHLSVSFARHYQRKSFCLYSLGGVGDTELIAEA